jgi:tetratricopeptide (TPR) repeat protein
LEGLKTTIGQVKQNIIDRSFPPRETLTSQLQILAEYECWSVYFGLLQTLIEAPEHRLLSDYVILAKAQHIEMEDIDAAAHTCALLVADLRIGFTSFRHEVLSEVVPFGDFESEAVILQKIYPMFTKNEDIVACLERLCLIFEKKRFDQHQLSSCYEKLIAISPTNLKALRYFKILYTQTNEWGEVIRILQAMYAHTRHSGDKFRIAQEIATLYQYQLDLPQKAIEVIANYCDKSPLDTSVILFDAYMRMRDWPACLKMLEKQLQKSTDPQEMGVLHFKIGELEEKMGQYNRAQESYYKSIANLPFFLDAYEKLTLLLLKENKWIRVLGLIESLITQTKNSQLQERLKELAVRIKTVLEQNPS